MAANASLPREIGELIMRAGFVRSLDTVTAATFSITAEGSVTATITHIIGEKTAARIFNLQPRKNNSL